MIYLSDPDFTLHLGDVLQELAGIADETVDCVVTSPPYYGLRDYGVDGQIGLEQTFGAYIENLVAVFAEVRRVLTKRGVVWLNMGDTYASKTRGSDKGWEHSRLDNPGAAQKAQAASMQGTGQRHRGKRDGFKDKDLMMVPHRLAIALQDDGWWVRSDVVWDKPNAMPESTTDRPTKSHEYVFLLTKSLRYFYDGDAVREPLQRASIERELRHRNRSYEPPGQTPQRRAKPHRIEFPKLRGSGNKKRKHGADVDAPGGGASDLGRSIPWDDTGVGRNLRSVWRIATKGYRGAHFAVFPEELVERCILAGCPPHGVVLDPFMGSGTTAVVARRLGRRSVGIELNPDYAAICAKRLDTLQLLLPEAV